MTANSQNERWHLVTGVTSGMGKAFADKIHAERNDRLIAVVRDQNQAAKTDADHHIFLDFAHPERVEAAFRDFDRPIDSFVNFAGILPGKSYTQVSPEDLSTIFNINVITPLLIIQAIEPLLRPGGTIALMGSISGFKGSYDDPYSATKGAVHSLVKSLALKFAPDRRVIGIAPGMTEQTRMTDELVAGRFEQTLEKIPLHKAGKPADIAEMIYFLLSDSCSFMTGAVIDVNGGQYLR